MCVIVIPAAKTGSAKPELSPDRNRILAALPPGDERPILGTLKLAFSGRPDQESSDPFFFYKRLSVNLFWF